VGGSGWVNDCSGGWPDATTGPGIGTTAAPATDADGCFDGYADYGTRYNTNLGRIVIAFSHKQCSDRCTQYSAPQYNGGCKGYMSAMYYGMLFCRSYGGRLRNLPCMSYANPRSAGIDSGVLGSIHPRTGQMNMGGNCCSNSTFVGF